LSALTGHETVGGRGVGGTIVQVESDSLATGDGDRGSRDQRKGENEEAEELDAESGEHSESCSEIGGEVGWREETGDRGDEKGEGEESLEDEVEVTRELRDCGRAGEVKNKS